MTTIDIHWPPVKIYEALCCMLDKISGFSAFTFDELALGLHTTPDIQVLLPETADGTNGNASPPI